MTNNKSTRSAIYLEIAQAIHSEFEVYLKQGDIAHFNDCEVIFEFTDIDARKNFALQIEAIVNDLGDKHGLSENAKSFLCEHFQLKIVSKNITKCMFEHLCFSPIGIIPTALTLLLYSRLAHTYKHSGISDLNVAEKYKDYIDAINEIVEQPIPKGIQQNLILMQKDNYGQINESLFSQMCNIHSNATSTLELNHTFLWVEPERVISNPIEDEKQLRMDFTKLYGELITYILNQEKFKDVTGNAMKLFNQGHSYGLLHTSLATFLQYPLFIFMSARDHADMAKRLGEGFFAYLFAVFAPCLTMEETPNSFVVHMVPVMSLDEMSKKVAVTYLAGIYDWHRSLCFGAKYFDRLTAANCYDYYENYIKEIFPKGFKTVINAKPIEMKSIVWDAYVRGLNSAEKRNKKSRQVEKTPELLS